MMDKCGLSLQRFWLAIDYRVIQGQTSHQVTETNISGEGRVVCVTGASGFVASWLVKLLLACGYSVHSTVRSLDNSKLTERLGVLDGAKERLSLFEANLLEKGSFESAVNGCECVFHTGSPVHVSVSDPQFH